MRWNEQWNESRQRLRQRGLADAGNVFDQQVAAREQRGQRQLDDVFLALHDARDRALKLGEAGCWRRWSLVCNSRGLLLQKVCYKEQFCGRLAQWLERSPHTGEVQGSSPWSPTIPHIYFTIIRSTK